MFKEFEKRLISSIILILVTFLVILEGEIFFNIFLFIAFLISSYEWIKMIKRVDIKEKRKLPNIPVYVLFGLILLSFGPLKILPKV